MESQKDEVKHHDDKIQITIYEEQLKICKQGSPEKEINLQTPAIPFILENLKSLDTSCSDIVLTLEGITKHYKENKNFIQELLMFFNSTHFENLKLFTFEIKKADLTTQELTAKKDIPFHQIDKLILNFSSVHMNKNNITELSQYLLEFTNIMDFKFYLEKLTFTDDKFSPFIQDLIDALMIHPSYIVDSQSKWFNTLADVWLEDNLDSTMEEFIHIFFVLLAGKRKKLAIILSVGAMEQHEFFAKFLRKNNIFREICLLTDTQEEKE